MDDRMLFRFTRYFVAAGLLLAIWALTAMRESKPREIVRPVGVPGVVRILQFYASVGALTAGDKALLCYGVENAKSVRISPLLQGVAPSPNRCLEIVPEHTTHYTIQAEGFDGRVATQSFTLPVQARPVRRQAANYATVSPE